MKTALITTTINVPTVLALYRKLDPSIKFFVAADHKTPLEAYTFCADIPDCEIYSPKRQKELGYECSELLGWNTDSRRNIALLEALKDRADIIVSIDDDMLLQNQPPCMWFEDRMLNEYDGLKFGGAKHWFDAGAFTIPKASQRGLPIDAMYAANPEPIVGAKIGVAQGVILGVPDTDACTAIAQKPLVHSATDILRNGFVVDLDAFTVFNSQLVAFRRELAPAFAQFYNHQGRNTDILASVLMRRIMRDRDLYTYFGCPTGFHARAPRPLFNDLRAEMYGLERIAGFAEYLWGAEVPAGASTTVEANMLICGFPGFSKELKEAYGAFHNDCARVM